jgi:hypothetical protein
MPKRKASSSPKIEKRKFPNSLSPLLRSAFEVLEHGLWHYLRSNTTTDMKFALLHIDQAIELLLKEKIRSEGRSIYKNPKETITIWGAYQILENDIGCIIKEKPDLELLHEERNNIQHKYANPTPEDAAFHVANAMKFIERFVSKELKLNLYDFIPREQLEQVL